MEERLEGLALGAAREGGKPLADSLVEVRRAIDGVRSCREVLRTEGGHVDPDEPQRRFGRPRRLHAERAHRPGRRGERVQPTR
jgi:acyl-CoA reductase-like NAD-dependent aldehyde dehydrogenase